MNYVTIFQENNGFGMMETLIPEHLEWHLRDLKKEINPDYMKTLEVTSDQRTIIHHAVIEANRRKITQPSELEAMLKKQDPTLKL